MILQNYSWGQFALTVGVGMVVYYGFLAIRLYRGPIRAFFSREEEGNVMAAKKLVSAPGQTELFPDAGLADQGEDGLFEETELVFEQLRGVIDYGLNVHAHEEDLMPKFSEVLVKHVQLRGTPYQVAIERFLVRRCLTCFSWEFRPDELSRLWTGWRVR